MYNPISNMPIHALCTHNYKGLQFTHDKGPYFTNNYKVLISDMTIKAYASSTTANIGAHATYKYKDAQLTHDC